MKRLFKKASALMLLFALSFAVVACDELQPIDPRTTQPQVSEPEPTPVVPTPTPVEPTPEPTLTNQEKLALDLEALDFTEGELTSHLTLPTRGSEGSRFTWTSSNPHALTHKGNILLTPLGHGPASVTLSAVVTNGTASQEVSFDFIIPERLESVVTESTTLDFESFSKDYIVESGMLDVFFVDHTTVPFVDVESFIRLVEGAIVVELLNFDYNEDVLTISYVYEYTDIDDELVTDYYEAVLNFTENTLTVNTFSFFGSYVARTETNYGEGLVYVGVDYVDPQPVVIPIGDYRFDIILHQEGEETLYLMPLHLADLFFLGDLYYSVYYNGDQLFGVGTNDLLDNVYVSEYSMNLRDLVRTSSLNSAVAPVAMKIVNYDYLALAFNYFYGLKNDKNIDNFYDVLVESVDALVFGTDRNMYRAMFDFVYGIDDLHTSHSFPGYYEPTTYGFTLGLGDLGPRTVAFYNGLWRVQDQLEVKFGDDLPARGDTFLLDDGKIGVIYLDGFDVDTPDLVKAALDQFVLDGVESVVIDLSYNTGGNLGAVLRIFGYMTEESIMYHSQNPADGSAVTYYIESEYEAYDFEWFILTSSVTYSAANLMASIAKDTGVATVIGQKSTGGASSIGFLLTPVGSGLLISTNNVLSVRVGDHPDNYVYVSVEYGVDVDYLMTNVTNDELIVQTVNQALADRAN